MVHVNEDFVPSTVRAAVDEVVRACSEEDKAAIWSMSPAEAVAHAHHSLGRYLRNSWSLWDKDTPLKRDCVTSYQIAHADDVSSLIMHWAAAVIRNETFDPVAFCNRFHEHWRQYGISSLQAGGM